MVRNAVGVFKKCREGKTSTLFVLFFEADGFPFVSFHMLSIAAKKFEKRGKNEKKKSAAQR